MDDGKDVTSDQSGSIVVFRYICMFLFFFFSCALVSFAFITFASGAIAPDSIVWVRSGELLGMLREDLPAS